MYIKDFKYGENLLSAVGFMVASVNTSNPDSISMGSEISFTTVKHNASHTNLIVNAEYSDVIRATFDIVPLSLFECNNVNEINGVYIVPNQVEYMMSWLNRKEYLKFQPIYEYEENETNASFGDIYYYGSFTNIDAIYINGKILGFTLTFESNSPFGYTKYSRDITSDTGIDKVSIDNMSKETGYTYFKNFSFTVSYAGSICIENSIDSSRYTIIDGCTVDEIITIDSFHKTISSSKRTNIGNSFNYVFPRLVKTFKEMNEEEGLMNSEKNIFTFRPATTQENGTVVFISGIYAIKGVSYEYEASRKVGIFA